MKDEIEHLLIVSLLEKSKFFLGDHDFTLEKLAGDASTRKYYRIVSGCKSFVGCLDEPTDGLESDFELITNYLQANHVGVPKIFVSYPEKGFMLQEDLGDDMLVNYLSKDYNEQMIIRLYKKAIDVMLAIQNLSQNSLPDVIRNKKFDRKKFQFELDISTKYFLEKYLGYMMSEDERENYNEAHHILIKFLLDKEYVPVHRDFHSRNLMIYQNAICLIDYQDMMLGSRFYDLVSLLEDTYFPLKNETKEILCQYFMDKSGLSIDKKDFIREYDFNSIQRIYKALGSFTYIYDTRKDDRYLKYISIGFSRLTSILEKYDEQGLFLGILYRAYHGN